MINEKLKNIIIYLLIYIMFYILIINIIKWSSFKKKINRDFPGCPVVKSPPSNVGDVGSIPGQGTKIPRAAWLLGPCATTREACAPQQRPSATKN